MRCVCIFAFEGDGLWSVEWRRAAGDFLYIRSSRAMDRRSWRWIESWAGMRDVVFL